MLNYQKIKKEFDLFKTYMKKVMKISKIEFLKIYARNFQFIKRYIRKYIIQIVLKSKDKEKTIFILKSLKNLILSLSLYIIG